MSIFPKINEFSSVWEHCPLVALSPDGLTYTKGGHLARVVELRGRDYSGLEPRHVEGLFQGRKAFFERIPDHVTVLYQAHRHELSRVMEEESYSLPMAQEIGRKWSESFLSTFRTRHFLVFVTGSDFFDQIMVFGGKQGDDGSRGEQRRELDEVTADALVRLQEYGAEELRGDKLSSYWAWLLNGRAVNQKAPADGMLDDLLSGTEIDFAESKRYQVYRSIHGERYSAWLIVKEPAPSTSSGLLNHLFQLTHNLSVYQSFSLLRKSEALAYIEDKRRNTVAFGQGVGILLDELQEVENRISAEELDLMRHRLALEVFADSAEALEQAVVEVGNAVERYGYRVGRESVNCEALYWSRFPGTHPYNVRQRKITSENASHMATFASVGEGLDRCTWGPMPVTLLKTTADTEFSFTFHESPAQDAPGNTLIIGGMGAGKTTLIAFLLSQCFKFPGFRALLFDRLHGLECFTRMHDGSYLSLDEEIDFLPLQLDDTMENRTFLGRWFQMLTGKTSDEDRELIGANMGQLFGLPKEERTLTNIVDAFGKADPGSVRKALQKWLPEEERGGFFNGTRDALDFKRPLVGVDMTSIIDDAEVLGPMAAYIFHRMMLLARQPGGYAIFIDEFPRYLRNEQFNPYIEVLLEEIRKTEGVLIAAAQTARDLLTHKFASKFQNNMTSLFLFSEPRADKKDYIDGLGLNEAEFRWIQTPHQRQVMLKRKEGESVILNIDLAPLGSYLKAISGGSAAVATMNTLRAQHPNTWKERYLAS